MCFAVVVTYFDNNCRFMSLKTYLVGIGISTFLCWAAFFLTITNIDPFTADAAGIASFFVSFFLGFLGLVILIMMYVYSRVSSVGELYERMPVLVRQALLIAFGLTALLGMQSMRVMRWWTAAMLIIILILVEISFYADRLDFEEMLEKGIQKEEADLKAAGGKELVGGSKKLPARLTEGLSLTVRQWKEKLIVWWNKRKK